MTKLTFYNGLREIGGTFVSVETDLAKCMFDFGFSNADLLDSNIAIRSAYCAADYARIGVLAKEDGIYDKATANILGVKAYEENKKESFFVISHMHIDHMGGLGMLHPDIPVYMSEDSLKLYRRLDAQEEAEVRVHRNCIGMEYQKPLTIGDITIEAVPVDHDVIGACGYRISTPDGVIAYTGDYRFHGYHPELTENFAKAVKDSDIFITEGVTVSFSDVDMINLPDPTQEEKQNEYSEYKLLDEMRTYAKEDGLLIINPYNRNVERIHNLIHTFKEEGRILVLDKVQADYVRAFYPEDPVFVYETARGGIGSTKEEISEFLRTSGFHPVTREELIREPKRYVLQQDYSDFYELLDLQCVISSYIQMDGAPLGDYDPSFHKMKALLDKMNIAYEYKATGGHSRPWYIRHMIDMASPKVLIPLHSFRPEQVNSKNIKERILPNEGESIFLEKGAVRREAK